MTLISNHFEALYFTDCNFDRPLTFESRIIIPTRQLGVIPGHPLNPTEQMIFLSQCYLIFAGVKKSTLQLTGYIENPPGSHHFTPQENPTRIISQEFTPELAQQQNLTLFTLEGVFDNPLEWADWEIESLNFFLMQDTEYQWDFTELWIDKTAFPVGVLVLVSGEGGISCIYEAGKNYQLVFWSFTYQEAREWLLVNKYERVEQRFPQIA
jgi:hypothetical protein